MSQELLEFVVPSIDLKFRAALLVDANPELVAAISKQLPLESVLGHVVVSGETIWVPTRIVHLGGTNMVARSLGSVYLYAPGQTICITYGAITESAKINKFGQILEADLPLLARLGAHVWEQTVARPRRSVVRVSVGRAC